MNLLERRRQMMMHNGKEYAVQSYMPLSKNYNPAVSILLEQQGYGTYVDVNDKTKGWYITKEEAAIITTVSTDVFCNKTSATDINGICGIIDEQYNFTTFNELKYFENIGYYARGSGNLATNYGLLYGCVNLIEATLPVGYNPGCYYAVGYNIDKYQTYSYSDRGFFNGCTNLKYVNNTNIVDKSFFVSAAFINCSSLINIELSNDTECIGNSLIKGCTSIEEFVIPTSTITIQDWFGFINIQSLTIPQNVISIGQWFLFNTPQLTEFTILAAQPPTLGYNPFYAKNNLQHIYVPANSVASYQSAPKWSDKASIISAIPT